MNEEDTGKGGVMACDISNNDILRNLAPSYVWWKTPDEALKYPDHLMARIMDFGTIEDMADLVHAVGRDRLRLVIARAEAGWFRPQSWYLWHYWLGLARFGKVPVPPLPERNFH